MDFLSKIPKPKLPALPLPQLPSLGNGLNLSRNVLRQAGKMLEGGAGFVTASIGNVPLFGSVETAADYDHQQTDEKHYFLIPDDANEHGFAVYVMRCLPGGVPPINELPKQRFVHLPSEHALPMLKNILKSNARDDVSEADSDPNFISENISRIIDEIDMVDDKLFKGMLMVGGLVALANPLAGAALAVKAMMPSVGLIVSKHGLKLASDTATNVDVANRIRKAEKEVEQQFKSGESFQVINPLLAQFARRGGLDNFLAEPDALGFQSEDIDLSATDTRRLLGLTEQAIVTVCGVSHANEIAQLKGLILSDA